MIFAPVCLVTNEIENSEDVTQDAPNFTLPSFQDESTCFGTGITRHIFIRISAALCTALASGLVFLLAGTTVEIYELLFKSTGIILGTLVALYLLGKSHTHTWAKINFYP